ncbi:MAG: hypothetical protein Q7R97_03355 [Candidatus Daviesbacteria bacterium]|nr:hypothetical protein [Candidatus Daviesbacteria bacterium]
MRIISIKEVSFNHETDDSLKETILSTYRAAQEGKAYYNHQTNQQSFLMVNAFTFLDSYENPAKDIFTTPPTLHNKEAQDLAFHLTRNSEQLNESSLADTRWKIISRKFGEKEVSLVIPKNQDDPRFTGLLEGANIEDYLEGVDHFYPTEYFLSYPDVNTKLKKLSIALAQELPREDTDWQIFTFGTMGEMPISQKTAEDIRGEARDHLFALKSYNNDYDRIEREVQEGLIKLDQEPLLVFQTKVGNLDVCFLYDALSPRRGSYLLQEFLKDISKIVSSIPEQYRGDELDIFASKRSLFMSPRVLGTADESTILIPIRGHSLSSVKAVLNHEIVHQLLIRGSGDCYSNYIGEGMAQFLTTRLDPQIDNVLQQQNLDNPQIHSMIEDNWDNIANFDKRFQYSFGELVIQYLQDKYGHDQLFDIYSFACRKELKPYRNRQSDKAVFEKICQKKLGITLDAFLNEFKAYLLAKG